ncbi:MAG: CoA transferase [Acidimicrobiaceae bacterium]|nr:CoA transferase [Acidimicrobiaceae bacterium]
MTHETPAVPILDGIKVVEFAQLTAAPLAGTLLADLGAEVIHVEDPAGGDPGRRMGYAKDGVKLWWKVGGRNKRSITLDLRSTEGQKVANELVQWADVVITNMRPETLERWHLDWESLHAINPKLVMLHVTGMGANTTARNEPGFGKVGESMSGVVHITGFPDGPPVFTGFSHADTVTALTGAFAVSAALTRRHSADFDGEMIDLALFEGLFRLLEWQVPIYDQLGLVPERVGNQIWAATSALVNTYLTADDEWVTVTSGTPRSVQNIAVLVGLPADEFETGDQQAERMAEIDSGVGKWVAERTAAECIPQFKAAGVVCSRIFSVADIVEDQTFREREQVITVEDPELGPLRMPGVTPRLTQHPGRVWRTAPDLGQDNEYVYRDLLGIAPDRYEALRSTGTI